MASDQTIEQVLVTRGFLSEAQMGKVRSARAQLGGDLEDIILTMELLQPEEYQQVIQIAEALTREQASGVTPDAAGPESASFMSQDGADYQVVLPKIPIKGPALPELPAFDAGFELEDPLDGFGIPMEPVADSSGTEGTVVGPPPSAADFAPTAPIAKEVSGGLPRLPSTPLPESAQVSLAESAPTPAPESAPTPPGGVEAAVLPRLPGGGPVPERVKDMMAALEHVEFDESLAETMAPGLMPASQLSQDTSPSTTERLRAQLDTDELAEESDAKGSPSQREGATKSAPATPSKNTDGTKCHHCGHSFGIARPVLCAKCRAFLKPTPRNDRLIGQRLGGRFLLNGRLGAGGMGLVYHATDEKASEFVACKILPIQLSTDESTIKRFNLEAKVMLELNHPNIVRAIDFGFEEEIGCYLAMELLVGEEFKDFVQQRRILSPAEVIESFSQLCDAMAYSHSKGVVHRDLKPSNVFLMESDKGPLGHVKVIDFGIARLTAEDMPRHTVTGTFLGTPQYMSPEQAGAKSDLDHRSDVYSLGVMLYEVLVGRLPFVGDHIAQVLMHQLYMQPPTLHDIRPDMVFPERLQVFVDEVLSKEPNGRPTSMEKFKQGLLQALNDTKDTPWAEAEITAKVDDPAISQKLFEAANSLLQQCALPALDTSLSPTQLFERLTERLRTPPQETASVGEIAVLMLSEEIVEEAPVLVTTAPSVEPTAVIGRIKPISVPAHTASLATSPGPGDGSVRRPILSRASAKQVPAQDDSVRAAEAAFAQSQKRKFLFMLIFAMLFFGLLVLALWVAK